MRRNPARFRRGLGLNEFLKRRGGEGKCCDALFKLRWPNGFARPNCGCDKSCRLNARKLRRRCRRKRRTSVIAGTIFESGKPPLTIRFQATRLPTRTKKGVSAMQLHRQPGICCSADRRMRRELMRVTAERGGKRCLSGLARTSEEGHPRRIGLSAVKGFRESEMAERAEQRLQPGSRAASGASRRSPRPDAPRWKGPGSAGPARCRGI